MIEPDRHSAIASFHDARLELSYAEIYDAIVEGAEGLNVLHEGMNFTSFHVALRTFWLKSLRLLGISGKSGFSLRFSASAIFTIL